MRQRIRSFWDHDESLTVFLWLLVLFAFFLGPLSTLRPGLHLPIELVFGLVLLSGIWATIKAGALALIAATITLFALIFSVIDAFLPETRPMQLSATLLHSLVLALFLFVLVRQTMRAGPITGHRIKGAVAAYLLIALFCAKLYALLVLTVPGSFSGITKSEGAGRLDSLVYFSFITLTSVGYGDILPTHVWSRTLASFEALIGQLFPAIFIARLVSLQIERR